MCLLHSRLHLGFGRCSTGCSALEDLSCLGNPEFVWPSVHGENAEWWSYVQKSRHRSKVSYGLLHYLDLWVNDLYQI